MRRLLGDGQLFKRPARGVKPPVDLGTLGAASEALLSGTGIRIGFPQPAAQAVFALVLDEADDVAQRVAKEQTDLMGEAVAGGEAAREAAETAQKPQKDRT